MNAPKEYEFHEVANIFPLLTGEDYTALRDDIAANGLHEPIWLHPDGRIIDGRNRYIACLDAGIEPRFRTWRGDGSLVSFVVSLNLHRRHLTASQRAALAVDVLPMLEAENPPGRPPTEKVSTIGHNNGRNTEAAGSMFGVGKSYVSDAKKLSQEAPDLLDQVRVGDITLPQAKREMKTREREHRLKEYTEQSKNKNISDTIKFYNGDMLDITPGLEPFDLVIADPPYNVTSWEWDKQGTREQFIETVRLWLVAIKQVLEPEYNLFWFCSPSYAADIEILMRTLGLDIKSRIVWHRRNMSMGSDSKNKFIDSWEMILHAGNKELNFSDKWSDERFDVQTHAVPQTNFKDEKIHPTQKPIKLIEWLVSHGSFPGERVLDPFAGSGTTGEACLNIGRDCELIEMDADYYALAKGRLSNVRF